MSRGVIGVRGTLQFLVCHLKSSIRSRALGRSHYRDGYSWSLARCNHTQKVLLIVIDYFSKWVEVEAYASIKDKEVSRFVWKNIVCRFEIPQAIIADNGPQFDSIAFRTFYSKLKIKNLYSTPCYSQSNGQTKVTNKTLLTALKKILELTKGKWVDELPGVLWAYRTTPRRPT